ncbi:hypothetical protein HNQ93_002437 [Hymenobacter luteus]|uniref:DUF3575 domain-containing protein n=2 Tax=Hymenobacter TaxID=89966 RepID=A0A7W9T0X7_9BACT|nr:MULTISPECIES: hypothetical protein [Hymenobacter]MBB4601994.1 hypothetical protein [Hymenobacter latericoloratus]MBB6059577.1 hypothetical protein [Hymenobacter luteus]
MNLKLYYLAALGLGISPRLHAQHQPGPDLPPSPAQVVKAGVRVFNQPDATGTYERQLTPQLSLLGGLGYFRQRYSLYGLWFSPAAGPRQPEELRGISHSYHADLQLRYYFRPRVARPALTGWYAAFALQGTYRRTTEVYVASATIPSGSSRRYGSTQVQPQVYLGRQWGLGPRIVLDTFVGTCVYRRESVNRRNPKALYLDAGGGLQIGWRL